MSEIDIKELRKKLNFSQEKLSEVIGVSLRTIQNWEAGNVIPKSKHALLRRLDNTGDGEILKKAPEYPMPNIDQEANVKDKDESCKDCRDKDAIIKSLNNYIIRLERAIEELGGNIDQARPPHDGDARAG